MSLFSKLFVSGIKYDKETIENTDIYPFDIKAVKNFEEQKYLEIKNKIYNFFKNNKIKKDKNHIYKRCNKCHTIIRLPLPEKRGIKYTTCPKCKTKNKVLALRKIKIELIRKNDNKSPTKI